MMKMRGFVIVLAAFSILLSVLVASCNETARPSTPSPTSTPAASPSPAPTTADDWYNRGLYLMAENKFQDAVFAFEQSLALNSGDAEAWDSKGYCLYELGRYEESLRSIDKALQIEPVNALYLHAKGLTLFALKRYPEAVKAYDAATDINPSYREAWYDKCQCLETMGLTGETQKCKQVLSDLNEFKNLDKPLIER